MMWPFFIAIFGAFLYGVWALWNVSILPSPGQIRSELRAEHMVVYHSAARQKCEPLTAPCPNKQIVIPDLPAGYQSADRWESKVFEVGGDRLLVTYAKEPVLDRDEFTWALSRFSNKDSTRVGWMNSDNNACIQTGMRGDKPCISQRIS